MHTKCGFHTIPFPTVATAAYILYEIMGYRTMYEYCTTCGKPNKFTTQFYNVYIWEYTHAPSTRPSYSQELLMF